MSDYMDTPHYRVNKFVSTLRVMGMPDHGRVVGTSGVAVNLGDLEAVVRESAERDAYARRLTEAGRSIVHAWRVELPAAAIEALEAVFADQCGSIETRVGAIAPAQAAAQDYSWRVRYLCNAILNNCVTDATKIDAAAILAGMREQSEGRES